MRLMFRRFEMSRRLRRLRSKVVKGLEKNQACEVRKTVEAVGCGFKFARLVCGIVSCRRCAVGNKHSPTCTAASTE